MARQVADAGGGGMDHAEAVPAFGDGAERLRDWLIALVIMTASVRISEKDAAAIVAGPSLI